MYFNNQINRRKKTIVALIGAIVIFVGVTIIGTFIPETYYAPDFAIKNNAPSITHIFGTDFMGRDMFWRTFKGLSTSIWIGLFATTISSFMAVVIGLLSGMMGKKTDRVVGILVDLFVSVPHLLLLIMLCVVMGRGAKAIAIAVIITHWPGLSRIIRADVLSLRTSQYVQASRCMGKNKLWIAKNHIFPHIIPQFVVGLILLFPHAIMHEASITFLGFGIPSELPAIGVILSESMKYLSSGYWWLAVFPGAMLLVVVLLLESIGDNTKRLIDPVSGQE